MAALLDNFNRADEAALNNGGKWSGPAFPGNTVVELLGLRACGKNSAFCDAYLTTKYPANQIAGGEIAAKTTSRLIGLQIRIQNPNTSNINCYALGINTSTNLWEVASVVKGKETLLKSATKAIAVTDRIYLEANGTTIKAIHETEAGVKTTIIEATSSAVTGEGFIGPFMQGAGSSLAIDNFFGGALEEAGTVYNDSGSGTITLTGSGTESSERTDSGSGMASLTGSSAESAEHSATGEGSTPLTGSGTDAATASDSGLGTVGVSGTGTDSLEAADAPSGTVGISGSGVEEWVGPSFDDSGSGTIGLSGSGSDSRTADDAGSGSLGLSGSGVDAGEHSGTGSGTFTLTGQGDESWSSSSNYEDSGTGAIGLAGSGTDSFSVSESRSGTIELVGSGVETLERTDAGAGTVSLAGSGTDSADHARAATGLLTLTGKSLEEFIPGDVPNSEPPFSVASLGGAQLGSAALGVSEPGFSNSSR